MRSWTPSAEAWALTSGGAIASATLELRHVESAGVLRTPLEDVTADGARRVDVDEPFEDEPLRLFAGRSTRKR
jgi:hypothetical protein